VADPDTNRAKAMRGEVVRVSDKRLFEMHEQAVMHEGVTANPVYHWHWAAITNELIALRRIVKAAARDRGIPLSYENDTAAEPK
jgi:hypothetical protein